MVGCNILSFTCFPIPFFHHVVPIMPLLIFPVENGIIPNQVPQTGKPTKARRGSSSPFAGEARVNDIIMDGGPRRRHNFKVEGEKRSLGRRGDPLDGRVP